MAGEFYEIGLGERVASNLYRRSEAPGVAGGAVDGEDDVAGLKDALSGTSGGHLSYPEGWRLLGMAPAKTSLHRAAFEELRDRN